MDFIRFVDSKGVFQEISLYSIPTDTVQAFNDTHTGIDGYLVSVPFHEGFIPYTFANKSFYFDLKEWDKYMEVYNEALRDFNNLLADWEREVVAKPDIPKPVFDKPDLPILWKNQHTPEEIKAFTNQTAPKSIEQKIADLELKDQRNQRLIASMYEAIMMMKGMKL